MLPKEPLKGLPPDQRGHKRDQPFGLSRPSSGKGKGKGKCEGKGKSKGERARTPSARPYSRTPPRDDNLAYLPLPPACLVERRDGPRFQRNTTVDFREVDRLRRENEVSLRRGASMHDPPNEAYRDWHERAWVGHHPDPRAENRYRWENEGFRVEDRGRDGTWYPTLPPSNMQPRQRTRTPRPGKGKGKDNGPDTRVYVNDGVSEWEVVDYEL